MNYERTATTVAAAHQTFVADLRSLMLGLRLAGQLTAAGKREIARESNRALREFIRAADTVSADHLEGEFAGALTQRENALRRTPFLSELLRIGREETAQLQARVRGSGLRGLLGEQGSPLAQLARRADEAFEPTAQDSAGRTWKGDKLVRFLARDFAYQSHLDAVVFKLQAAGATVAQVVYLDPLHENNGLVIELPIDEEIRREIFHPNAHAHLAALVHALA